MLGRLRELSARRATFALETTLAGRTHAPWIRSLLQGGCDFHLMYLWLRSADLAVQRVRARVRKGGHDVPEDFIRKRYRLGIRNFFELYQALAATWAVYDSSATRSPILVAQGERPDQISVYRADLWQNVCEGRE